MAEVLAPSQDSPWQPDIGIPPLHPKEMRKRMRDIDNLKSTYIYTTCNCQMRPRTPDPHSWLSKRQWRTAKDRWTVALRSRRSPTPPPPKGPPPVIDVAVKSPAPVEPAAFEFSIDAPVFHPGAYRESWPPSLAWLGGIPGELLPSCDDSPGPPGIRRCQPVMPGQDRSWDGLQ